MLSAFAHLSHALKDSLSILKKHETTQSYTKSAEHRKIEVSMLILLIFNVLNSAFSSVSATPKLNTLIKSFLDIRNINEIIIIPLKKAVFFMSLKSFCL